MHLALLEDLMSAIGLIYEPIADDLSIFVLISKNINQLSVTNGLFLIACLRSLNPKGVTDAANFEFL